MTTTPVRLHRTEAAAWRAVAARVARRAPSYAFGFGSPCWMHTPFMCYHIETLARRGQITGPIERRMCRRLKRHIYPPGHPALDTMLPPTRNAFPALRPYAAEEYDVRVLAALFLAHDAETTPA